MKLTLNLSPCPNDTFMFYALLHGRIDTEGLRFEPTFADIEQLNKAVTRHGSDISKISYAVLPMIRNDYQVLDSGSALGRGNGPLLVSRHALQPSELQGVRIAVPGLHTTAHLLLKRLFPGVGPCTPHLFSDIAPIVARGDFEAGVLIHEGRFTYTSYGLQRVADLGLLWEQTTALPLPLGAIVVSRKLAPGNTSCRRSGITTQHRICVCPPRSLRRFCPPTRPGTQPRRNPTTYRTVCQPLLFESG